MMLSYYLEKGHSKYELYNLSENEIRFYKASMLFNIERQIKEKKEFMQILFGGING